MATPAPPSNANSSAPIVCPGHLRPVVDVQYSSPTEQGVFIVSACHDKNPMLRWGDNGDWIGTFAGHKGAVWSACLDGAATKAATGSADFSAKIWNAVSGECLHTFDHRHIVKAVQFHSDGSKLLTGGHEKKTRIFDLEAYDSEPTVYELPSMIRKATWLEDKNSIVCGCSDGTVRVWDTRVGSEVHCTQVAQGEIEDLELSMDASLATLSSGKEVSFFETSTFELVKKHTFNFKVEAASLHPSKSHFVAGGSDLWVHVLDFETGEETACHKGHHGPVFCIRYAPDGKSYASGSEDGTIRIWRNSRREPSVDEESPTGDATAPATDSEPVAPESAQDAQ